ncbi:MAG: hypothetical protein JO345_23815 [Streptosporangiaceae bacterium]|nr:hypothetical protein [Streptosporangiaceae bacterium]
MLSDIDGAIDVGAGTAQAFALTSTSPHTARKLRAKWKFARRIRTLYFRPAWMFRFNPHPVRDSPDIQGNPRATGSHDFDS